MHNGLLFLVLLSAHLLGDFYLQTNCLAAKKEKNYTGLLLHALIYTVCVGIVFLVVEVPWQLLLIASGSHWLIDSVKWLLRKTKLPKAGLFIIDQALHGITLGLLAMLTPEMSVRSWLAFLPESFWPWLTLILVIMRPVNICVDVLFEKFANAAKEEGRRQDLEAALKRQADTLVASAIDADQPGKPLAGPLEVEGAGAWVGLLERLITVLFASLGQYSAMGLLMAAKSMARYDKISKGPAFAEYYLIGTLFSILFALAAYLFVFKMVFPVSAPILPTPIILITPTPLP